MNDKIEVRVTRGDLVKKLNEVVSGLDLSELGMGFVLTVQPDPKDVNQVVIYVNWNS